MMNRALKVSRSITIEASPQKVWKALTDKEIIKKYFFGTEADSDWKAGSTVVFSGTWEGKAYEDKGNILQSESGSLLQYDFWSSMSGMEDKPENYALVTYKMEQQGSGTLFTAIQEGFATPEGQKHAEGAWQMVLEGLKKEAEDLV